MIFSENRYPLFGIMLDAIGFLPGARTRAQLSAGAGEPTLGEAG